MVPSRAKELSDRFAADAELLRVRAAAPAAERGPDPATSERMADACDRVSALFGSALAANEAALLSLMPVLERYEQEESDASVRSVYRGAKMRLRDAGADA